MDKNNKTKKENPSLINLVIIFILMYIPLFLMSKRLYVLVSIYVVLISGYLIWVNWKTIKKNIKSFSTERKRIKNLEYYHITDDDKLIDLEKRRTTFSLFSNITMGTFLILMVNFMAIHSLIQQFWGESAVLNLITTIVVSLIAFIGYGGMIAGVVYKYTTTTYVVMPIISALIYFSLIDPLIAFFPDFARFAGYLFITIIFYLILAYSFPAHILRKLNGKTVLISSFTTILATFSSQILEFYFSNFIQNGNYLLTIENVKNATDVSDTLKNIVLDNPKLVDIINHFLLNETSNILSSMTSLVITALTISYIFGGLMINRKIRKNKSKAKSIYRILIIKKSLIDYHTLIKCSFYGGEEYENLLLNNDTTQKVIKENEIELAIPDVSRKTRFIAWWQRNSPLYSTYTDIKEVFNSRNT